MDSINFFPEIVYRCDCLVDPIASCLAKKTYSFKDICNEINEINGEKIYSVKCGEDDKDVVLSCSAHMPMGIFAVQLTANDAVVLLETKNSCLTCIRKYLRENYYLFKHVIFKE